MGQPPVVINNWQDETFIILYQGGNGFITVCSFHFIISSEEE